MRAPPGLVRCSFGRWDPRGPPGEWGGRRVYLCQDSGAGCRPGPNRVAGDGQEVPAGFHRELRGRDREVGGGKQVASARVERLRSRRCRSSSGRRRSALQVQVEAQVPSPAVLGPSTSASSGARPKVFLFGNAAALQHVDDGNIGQATTGKLHR